MYIKNKGEYDKAVGFYDEVLEFHFFDILADDALFNLAEINHFIYEDLEAAQGLYERILLEYPGSLYVVESRKRFRELRGDEL